MPVKQENSIATPSQPTIERPQTGTIKLPWIMCIARISPELLFALSSTRAVGGSSQMVTRDGGPACGLAPPGMAATTTGPSPLDKVIDWTRSSGLSTDFAAAT